MCFAINFVLKLGERSEDLTKREPPETRSARAWNMYNVYRNKSRSMEVRSQKPEGATQPGKMITGC